MIGEWKHEPVGLRVPTVKAVHPRSQQRLNGFARSTQIARPEGQRKAEVEGGDIGRLGYRAMCADPVVGPRPQHVNRQVPLEW